MLASRQGHRTSARDRACRSGEPNASASSYTSGREQSPYFHFYAPRQPFALHTRWDEPCRYRELQAKKDGLTYLRYMDDILVLAPTRWKLRKAVITVNRTLNTLELEKHPDKTFVGRIAKGFDFLGYHFTCDDNTGTQLTLAAKTIANFNEKLSRLYEQWGLLRNNSAQATALETRINTYINRFNGWAHGGLGNAVQQLQEDGFEHNVTVPYTRAE